jgi:hypothetical protein
MISIGGWSSGRRSHLGSRGTFKKTLYEIFKGKIVKQVAGTSSGLRKSMDWASWKGPSSVSVRRAGYVGVPATPGIMAPLLYERERENLWMMVIHLDLLAC